MEKWILRSFLDLIDAYAEEKNSRGMTLQAIRMRSEILSALRLLLAETGDRRTVAVLRACVDTTGIEVGS